MICPHCKALVQSSICWICGRSSRDEVEAPAQEVRQKWWTKLESGELRKVGTTCVLLVLFAGTTFFVLSRPDAETVANELPPPASTTTAPPSLEPRGQAPSIAEGAQPGVAVAPGAPREVGTGLSPWQTTPPIDFVSGLLLDDNLDYSSDIARVKELLTSFPEIFGLDMLDPPELLTFIGPIDVETLETSQPFAARTIRRERDGLAVGELWLIASSGTEVGDAYLAAARARWDSGAAIDQFSTEVGVRLWLLGADDETNLWASDLDDRSMAIIQAPAGLDPTALTDAIGAWRKAITDE
jgi:hypothetical protein